MALRYGIDIKQVYHYTVVDLQKMIVARAEAEHQQAWEIGARVLEAIGSAFGKNKKYTKNPPTMVEETEENTDQKLIEYIGHFMKHN